MPTWLVVASEKYIFLYIDSYKLTFCKGLLRIIVIYIYIHVQFIATEYLFLPSRETFKKTNYTSKYTIRTVRNRVTHKQ